MIARIASSVCLAMLGTAVQAAVPTAVVTSSSVPVSFVEYASSTLVGEGLINANSLYFVPEQSGLLGDSWYVFFEPRGLESLTATITFDTPITAIYTTQDGLAGSSSYQSSSINYSYTNPFVGLESRTDSFSYAANTLTLTISSRDPGDHIRVLTASPVPEPASYALIAAGLMAVGFAAKRRSDKR